jgi:hypothetical protein
VQGDRGCTVGVIRIPGGFLFFKNRDLSREYLVRRPTTFESTPHFHALRGVNLQTGEPEGVSIGVNRHGICVANTHVASTRDVTYDLLCEEIVRRARCRGDVPHIVAEFMSHNRVQGGRLLVAFCQWAYLIEVYITDSENESVEPNFVMTNTFSLLAQPGKQDGVRAKSSALRLQVAQAAAAQIGEIGALKSLLRSHVPERGEFSICNHRRDGGGTESSHVIQVQGKAIAWSWLAGHPCENEYSTIQLFDHT